MTNSKPWLWLLVGSLALNAFLAVTVSTFLLRGPRPSFDGPPGPPRPDMMIRDMANELPEADARILRQAYEAHRAELAPPPSDGFHRMEQTLQAEPFDVAAFREAAREFRANQERQHVALSDILAEALPQMSQEGRNRLAHHRRPPPR
jgi:uncharacterized membrane protein